MAVVKRLKLRLVIFVTLLSLLIGSLTRLMPATLSNVKPPFIAACKTNSTSYVFRITDENRSFCSHRSTLRGKGQQVLGISIFGPTENGLFQWNRTLSFMNELIEDTRTIYPGWILRIYYSAIIPPNLVDKLQCQYDHVDFCDMTHNNFTPPKIWRFLPAIDMLVDASKCLLVFTSHCYLGCKEAEQLLAVSMTLYALIIFSFIRYSRKS